MDELKLQQPKPMKMLIDNRSAINLAKHLVAHERSKHIETQFHFIRDQVNKGQLELEHCRTNDQIVDIFTKAFKVEKFKELRDKLGVVSFTSLN